MAKFQKGNTLSKGRPPKPDEFKKLELMNRLTLQAEISNVMKAPAAHVDKAAENKELPSLRLALLKVQQRANDGDIMALAFLLNYSVGKPKEAEDQPSGDRELDAAHDRVIDLIPRGVLRPLLKLKQGGNDDSNSGSEG